MSAYPPPDNNSPIYNTTTYQIDNSSLTVAEGDDRYLRLTGSISTGLQTFNGGIYTNGLTSTGLGIFTAAGISTANIYNGAFTFSVPGSSGQLALVSQIPSSGSFVDLTTTQTISGTKNFTAGTGIATSGVYPRTSASTQYSSTFTTPSIQIGGSTNDGLYSSGTDIIDIGCNGTNYISLQPQGIYRFVGGTIDPAIVFNQRVQCMNSVSGATNPAIQFDNQNSGFYRQSQGVIGIGCSGVAIARWSSAGLGLFGVAGTAAAPAITMNNDTTSGFYRPAADQVGISCNGSQVGNFTTSGLTITGSISASTTALTGAGSVGTPAIQMGGDTTSGFYRSGANEVAISTSGIQRGKWSSTGLAITGISQTSIPMATMMTKSTAQSTANGSAVSVVSYNVSSNPSSYFTLNTTNGTITFTVSDAPCMILVSGQIQFPTNAFTFIREIWIEDNSGLRWVDANRNATNDAGDTSKSAIAGMRMITTNATYTLIMKIYQNTGGTINSGGIVSTNLTTFCCARIN